MKAAIFATIVLFLIPLNAIQAADNSWKTNWVFKEASLFLEQAANACTLLNKNREKAECQTGENWTIILHTPIDDAASVDFETAELRYNIRRIQILAMRLGDKIRMIDKSQEPYMTGLYGFVRNSENYGGRMKQESYSTLIDHCATYAVPPPYCE